VANLKVSEGITLGDNINPFFMPGDIVSIFTSTIPNGWILCDGSEYLQISYPDLFNSASTYYNDGTETPGHFRVPNLSGNPTNPVQPAGVVGSNNSGAILGGGYYNHTHTRSYTGISESTNDLNSHFHNNSTITGGNSQEIYRHLHDSSSTTGPGTNATGANIATRGSSFTTGGTNHSHVQTSFVMSATDIFTPTDNFNSTYITHKHNSSNNFSDSSGGITNNTNSTTDTSAASHYHTATYAATLSGISSHLPTLYVKYIIKV
jgi:hypothetical protein